MGAVVALHLARRHPRLVDAIVAFGPALFASRADAETHIAALGPMARAFARDTAVARRACAWVCEHRGAATVVAAVLRPDLPTQLTRDGVQHTWESYSRSLERLILDADAVPLVEAANVPIGFVAGGRDRVPDIPLLERLAVAHDHVTHAIWPDDDHDLLLTSPDRALDELRNALTRSRDAPAPV